MEFNQIKNKIFNGEEYKFLWNNDKLNKNIILLTLGGSHSHGYNIESSDIDLRGITLNTAQEILTIQCANKPYQDESNVTDTVIYPLKQMIELLCHCNPNILTLYGCRDEQYIILTKEGKLIKDNIDLFLHKRVIVSFGEYASQQFSRLQNALARDSYPQNEKEKHILNSLNRQQRHLQEHYTKFDKDSIKLYIDKSNKTKFDDEIFIDINLNNYPLRDLNGLLSEMTNVVRDYDKLNNRNKKKDRPHLLKHALTLILLLKMGAEILETGKINTYRENERNLFLDIRNDKISFENIFEMVNKLRKEYEYACDNTILPDKPDWDKINELTIQINRSVIDRWRSLKK